VTPEVFISFLIVIAVFVWIMVLHDRTVREMLAVLERQTSLLERLAPPDGDEPRPPMRVVTPLSVTPLSVTPLSVTPLHGTLPPGWTLRPPDGHSTTSGTAT
jgi:hypothetical protein